MKKTSPKSLTMQGRQSSLTRLSRLSQGQVVTLAAYLLGGDKQVLDTEDIAVKANELAPGRFAWRKYKDQINLELVRVYLSAVKKKSKGGMVAGSGKTGWTLTSAGRAWVRGPGEAFLAGSGPRQQAESTHATSPTEARRHRERARMQATQAWSRWTRQEDISPREAAEVFRIDTYARGRIRDLKVGRVRVMFEDDPELGAFIRKAAELIETGKDPQ
jgi:hypothetical protein